jgi:hypothetical protein
MSRLPRMLSAAWAASSGVRASLMPPALPRPPISTCALTTTGLPSRSATAFAPAGVLTTSPCGVGTPKSLRICFAWYSCSFIVGSCGSESIPKCLWACVARFCLLLPPCARLTYNFSRLQRGELRDARRTDDTTAYLTSPAGEAFPRHNINFAPTDLTAPFTDRIRVHTPSPTLCYT